MKIINQTVTNWIALLFISIWTTGVSGQEPSEEQHEIPFALVELTPEQCVAMTEGQTCYADIKIYWQVKKVGNYCLITEYHSEPIQCWQSTSSGERKLKIAAEENVIFSLQDMASGKVIADAELQMAWVYKKRGKPTSWWRIF